MDDSVGAGARSAAEDTLSPVAVDDSEGAGAMPAKEMEMPSPGHDIVADSVGAGAERMNPLLPANSVGAGAEIAISLDMAGYRPALRSGYCEAERVDGLRGTIGNRRAGHVQITTRRCNTSVHA